MCDVQALLLCEVFALFLLNGQAVRLLNGADSGVDQIIHGWAEQILSDSLSTTPETREELFNRRETESSPVNAKSFGKKQITQFGH
jgi:hypothetical protein